MDHLARLGLELYRSPSFRYVSNRSAGSDSGTRKLSKQQLQNGWFLSTQMTRWRPTTCYCIPLCIYLIAQMRMMARVNRPFWIFGWIRAWNPRPGWVGILSSSTRLFFRVFCLFVIEWSAYIYFLFSNNQFCITTTTTTTTRLMPLLWLDCSNQNTIIKPSSIK